jgi:Flp pilus assembly protein TadG
MTHAPRHARRTGATVLECALVLPLVFFIMLALAVGTMGVFRYQEVATLAREGARYASTHGYQYRKDSGLAMGSSTDWQKDIYDNGIAPKIMTLDPKYITVTVSWPDVINQTGKPDNWPGSRVDITVSYQWTPAMLWTGPMILTNTSSMPITN